MGADERFSERETAEILRRVCLGVTESTRLVRSKTIVISHVVCACGQSQFTVAGFI